MAKMVFVHQRGLRIGLKVEFGTRQGSICRAPKISIGNMESSKAEKCRDIRSNQSNTKEDALTDNNYGVSASAEHVGGLAGVLARGRRSW